MAKLIDAMPELERIRFANLPGDEKQLNCKMPKAMLDALSVLAKEVTVTGSVQDLTLGLLEQILCKAAQQKIISWPSDSE